MSNIIQKLQQQHAQEFETFKELQKDMQKNHGARNQFQTQKSENTMVLKELELLEDDAVVYKMVGPLMVKQDLVEAKSNVGKRLEYIDGEMTRLDSQLASIEKKQVDRQKEIQKIQERLKDIEQQGKPQQ